ncbi:phage portal protein [Enterococcus faecium]
MFKPLIDSYSAVLKKFKGKDISATINEEVNIDRLKTMYDGYDGDRVIEIRFIDPRRFTVQQRNFIYALIGDIFIDTGMPTDFWKEFFYFRFEGVTGRKISLKDESNTTVSDANVLANIVLDREFLESDVIYIKYADQQIRQLVDAYYQAYGKLISSAMNVYKRSNARRYVLKGNLFRPQDNTTQDQINKMMTSQFKAFMEADNAGAVFQLQNEYTLEDFSGNFQSNSRDIKNLIDDIFEMTAAAFHVPKNLLKGDMSGLSDQVDAFLMFEIIPIAELIQDAFNASLYEVEEYLSGNFVRVDTTMIKITSFKDLVDAIDVGIRNGVFTINEGRERVGNDRSDKAMADEIFITKNNQQVSKGGEANDDNENISSSKE